jgi:hypothetical protein
MDFFLHPGSVLRTYTGRATRDERGLTGEHIGGYGAQALLDVTGVELGDGACSWWPAVAHVLVPLHAHIFLEPLGARVGVLRCPGTERPRQRSGPLMVNAGAPVGARVGVLRCPGTERPRQRSGPLMVDAGAPVVDQTVAPPLCVYHSTSMKAGATQEFMIYQKQK